MSNLDRERYESTPSSAAVSAMCMLDEMVAMTDAQTYNKLNNAWADQGYGFDGFCHWLFDFARYSEEQLAKRDPKDFPGVYDYEVMGKVGRLIKTHMLATGEMPDVSDVHKWIDMCAGDFFNNRGGANEQD